VIRKHTRRAARAAFAIAFAIPIVLGGIAVTGSAVASRDAKPTVVLGAKNFTEQYVLGQLYKQALQAKGFKVKYKENIGSSELIDKSLTSGQINMYPEYTGTIVQNIAHQTAPKTSKGTWLAMKKFEAKRGFVVLNKTPFNDTDGFGLLTSKAKQWGVKTIADVKKVKATIKFGGMPECQTRITCLVGLQRSYGLTNLDFVPLSGIDIYTALDQGKVDAGDIFTTDPQLVNKKYTVLKDTKGIYPWDNVAPIVSKKLSKAGGKTFTKTVNAVTAKLTTKAMIAMNKAVAVDKQSPASVAGAFLKANHLK
jgi:osmoprotectant transport system substrate-binding protein